MKYKYYSLERPVMPGTYPKPKNNPAMLIHNFNSRDMCRKSEEWRGDISNMTSRLKTKILTGTSLCLPLSFHDG